MLGTSSRQRSLYDAGYHFKHLVDEDSFHWQLSQVRDDQFGDAERSSPHSTVSITDAPPLSPVKSVGRGSSPTGK